MEAKLKSHFLSLYKMITADDDVDPKELETMYKIGIENFKLTQAEINEAILSPGTVIYVPETMEERLFWLLDLAKLAWADGKLEDSERTLLMVYAERYGIEESYSTKVVDFLLNEAKSGVSNEQMMSHFNKL